MVVLALNTAGPGNRGDTPIGCFRVAIQEKDVGQKCKAIEHGLYRIQQLDDDKYGDEVDRLFTLYLGFLGADLPWDTNQCIAETGSILTLSDETRLLAIDAIEGYLLKLKASKEDVATGVTDGGPSTGIGHGLKHSEWIEQTYLRALKSGKNVRGKK